MNANRLRTKKGTFRPVRGDTKVSTIEKRYDVDLGVRSDMKLSNFFKQKGYPSLSRMLRDIK